MSKTKWYKSVSGWWDQIQNVGVAIAIVIAGLTAFQAYDVHENFMVDERAWLVVKGFALNSEINEGNEFRIRVISQNTGKTPALDATEQHSIQFRSQLPACYEWNEKLARPNHGIIAPNLADGPYNDTEPVIAGGQDNAEYKKGGMKLYLWGMYRYKDIFHQEHWTRFCTFHEYGHPLTEFSYCGSCNEVDH